MAIEGYDHTYVETRDYPAARRFWAALGFAVDQEWGGEGHRACRLVAGDTSVVLAECAPGGKPQGPTAHFRAAAPEDLDARLRASGDVEVVTPLEPTHWNTRWIRVRDPDGSVWVLEAPPS